MPVIKDGKLKFQRKLLGNAPVRYVLPKNHRKRNGRTVSKLPPSKLASFP